MGSSLSAERLGEITQTSLTNITVPLCFSGYKNELANCEKIWELNMVNNLSEQAGQGGESNLVEKIRDSAATIWLAGLGAFSKGQEESGKIFDALVKEGEAVQSRASKSAQEKISDVRTKATEAWGQLEQVFEDRVERTLNRLSVPSKHDIDTLSKNVADLTRAVTKLSHSLDEGKKA